MHEGSISGSLDRMEAAIARIEAAARDRALPASAVSDEDLAHRHRELKTAVTAALARIDTLIEAQEP